MVLFGSGGKPAYVSNTNSVTVASIQISPDKKIIFLTNAESNSIVLIDPASDKVIGQIPTPTYPNRVAITPDGKTLVYSLGQTGEAVGLADVASRAFSGIQSQGKIHVIDVAQRKIIRTITTPKEAGPDPALPLD